MLRRFSLTGRLTLFFTLVAAVVVLGLGGLFMAAADRHFTELDHATLADKQHLIEDILAHAGTADDARRRLHEALSHHQGLWVQVRHPQGMVFFQSDPQGESALPAPHRLHAQHFEVDAGFAAAQPLAVTVSVDTHHHLQFRADLRRSLLAYTVLATLVSGLLGWLAARQGLAPLRTMKTRAAEVTAHQLQERMPVDAVPIEMADLAQELNLMLDRLQADFRRLQDFSSDLAHELRTPISNLLTQTQVTLSARRDADTYCETLASNAEELQRLARMVSDMLLLAKTERGVDLPHPESFAAAPDIQALFDFYEAVAEEKSVQLQLVGEGGVWGDRLMFRRAVSNLLSNALRHTPAGGQVKVTLQEDATGLSLQVANTGPAIDPQVLPRLFDRFYRADPARGHPQSDGAGLGLAITKALVQAHGGTASVRSDSGWTCFVLHFPQRSRSAPMPS